MKITYLLHSKFTNFSELILKTGDNPPKLGGYETYFNIYWCQY